MDEMTSAILSRINEIEQKDDAQIIAELAGETIREMVYSVDVKDRKTGKYYQKNKLSWAGTKEAARYRGNIMVDDTPNVIDLEDSIRVVVRVTDLSRNLSVFGGCHQPKRMKVYDRDEKTGKALDSFRYEVDDYAFQKALSKAQRNAFYTILPVEHIARCIDRFLKVSAKPKPQQIMAPREVNTNGKLTWETVTRDRVADYAALERVFWDITKKQPTDMYKELGVKSRTEMSVSAWEAFQQLKGIFNTPVPT